MTDFSVVPVVEPVVAPFGATVQGLDLGRPLDPVTADHLRQAWLRHQVLVFPDQDLSFDQLEAVALAFGPIGEDPYFRPISGQAHVVALTRDADEITPLFADVWHSDWSFMASPPAATLLYGVEIPPTGGDTLYADQYAAYDSLPGSLKSRIDGLMGIHSARRGYSKEGQYGDRDVGRSMAIVASDDALATQLHPLVRTHPETGRRALYCSLAYTIGIDGLGDDEATRSSASCWPTWPATSSSTGIGGRPAWWRCGTTVAWCTRRPVATRVIVGCCIG